MDELLARHIKGEKLTAEELDQLYPDLNRLIEEAEPMRIDKIGWLESKVIGVSLFVKIWAAKIWSFFNVRR